MKIQHSLLIPKPGQCGEPLDLADRKIYKQKNKRQQALRKDEKKILYYKLNSMEIQHSSQIFKPVHCEERLNLADRKKQEITNLQAKKKQQAPRKDEKKINYYKPDPMEIQHSLRDLKPVQCEERLI